MGAFEIILAFTVVVAGALVQGTVGFGQSIVAAPFLLLVDERLVPGPLLVAALAVTGLSVWRERYAVELGGFGWAFAGRVPGVVAGTVAVALLSPRGLGIVLGSVVLAAAAISASGIQVRRTRGTNLVAGFASGFGGTTTSIGGPPMALLYQDAAGPSLRATLGAFFALGAAMSVASLAAVGEFTLHELAVGLLFVPAVVVGFALSSKLTPHVDRGRTRPAVIAISVAGALAVLARSLL